jgi:hypothetical protein
MNPHQSMHGLGTPVRWVFLLAAAAGGALSGCAAATTSEPATPDRGVSRLVRSEAAAAVTAGAKVESPFGSFGSTETSESTRPALRLAGYADDVKPMDEAVDEAPADAPPTEKRLYMDCFLEGIELADGTTLASWFRDNPLRLVLYGHIDQSFTANIRGPESSGSLGRFNGLRLFDDRSHDYRFNQLMVY